MRKLKITLSFLLAISYFEIVYSQPKIGDEECHGNLVLSSQADVDAFTCLEVIGSLTISGPDITNIDGLSSLRMVSGDLWIENNSALETLDGLLELQFVGGDLRIVNNSLLSNMNALPSLKRAGNVFIRDNSNLTTLDGFSSLTEIDDGSIYPSGLHIERNTNLNNISGFNKLTTVNGVSIGVNPKLVCIKGFGSLVTIKNKLAFASGFPGYLQIYSNDALTNLQGFLSLTYVGGLDVIENNSLTNIDGLSNLREIAAGSYLWILKNPVLENVDGLSALRAAESGEPITFGVTQNPLLTRCEGMFPYFVSLGWEEVLSLSDLGIINVSENGAGCTVEDIIASGPQAISTFSVIDKRTGKIAKSFYHDSVTLDLGHPDFSYWTIQANTFPPKVGSVEFILDNKTKLTENVIPYTLQPFVLPSLKPGTHTLTAEVYSKSYRRGEQGIGRTATINVINSTAILSFEVVNASGKVLMNLKNGDKINIKDPDFKSISIRANTTPEKVGSVKFYLNKRYYRTENILPYALNGDNNGTYNPWAPKAGNYTLLGIPYSKRCHKGYAGESLEIHFRVVEENIYVENKVAANARDISHEESTRLQGEEISVSVFPVPVEDELQVNINNQAARDVHVTIRNIQGQLVYTGSKSLQQLQHYNISTVGFQSGVYFVQILDNNGFRKIVKFIKK